MPVYPEEVVREIESVTDQGRRYEVEWWGDYVRRTHCNVFHANIRIGGERRPSFVKVLKWGGGIRVDPTSEADQEYARIVSLHRWFGNESKVGVPEPLINLAHIGVIVMERCSGGPFRSLINQASVRWANRDRIAEAEKLCRLSGEWLRRFQDPGRGLVPAPFPREEALSAVQRLLRSEKLKFLGDNRRNRILNTAEACLQGAPAFTDGVTQHNDFTPVNIRAHGQGIRVVDFGSVSSSGMKGVDVAIFEEYVLSLSKYPIHSSSCLDSFVSAFREGYQFNVGKPDPLLWFYRIWTVLTLLQESIPGLSPTDLRKKVLNSFLRRYGARRLDAICRAWQ